MTLKLYDTMTREKRGFQPFIIMGTNLPDHPGIAHLGEQITKIPV